MTLTSVSSSPSAELGSCSKGSFKELAEASLGAAADEDELDDVAGGAEGIGERAAGDAAELSSLGTSSGDKITPPGGIFSLLYLHPGV